MAVDVAAMAVDLVEECVEDLAVAAASVGDTGDTVGAVVVIAGVDTLEVDTVEEAWAAEGMIMSRQRPIRSPTTPLGMETAAIPSTCAM